MDAGIIFADVIFGLETLLLFTGTSARVHTHTHTQNIPLRPHIGWLINLLLRKLWKIPAGKSQLC